MFFGVFFWLCRGKSGMEMCLEGGGLRRQPAGWLNDNKSVFNRDGYRSCTTVWVCLCPSGVGCLRYLRAHSRPLSPSSSSSLMVEGMDGSKAFRSTTPWPSLCSTPTLTPLPLCWNCTRRMLTPLTPRRCGFNVHFLMTKFLTMLKARGHRRICQ